MRHTFRFLMAAILFTAVAGFVSAQDTSSAPPPAPPEVVKPVDAVPVIPVAEEPAPVVEQAVPVVEAAPVVEQAVPVVEPVAVPAVVVPVAAEKPVVTTVKRVSKKTVAKPATHLSKTVEATVPAAVSAPVETAASAPSPEAAVVAAPVQKVAAPALPAKAAAVQSRAEETKSDQSMGLGGWLIAFLVVAALFLGITLMRRRRTSKRTSIVDLGNLSPELDPAYVTRR